MDRPETAVIVPRKGLLYLVDRPDTAVIVPRFLVDRPNIEVVVPRRGYTLPGG